MKPLKLIITIVGILCCVSSCYAQYEEFCKVENDTHITLVAKAKLYEIPSYLYDYILTDRPAKRSFYDVRYDTTKILKKSQKLRVRKYINTIKQNEFNAYVVEYKEKLWVVESCDVYDNAQLEAKNAQILSTKLNLETKRGMLTTRIDSLVAIYSKECRDSLDYYKKLRERLPAIKDSLENVVKNRYQQQRNKAFNVWLGKQTASVKKAASIILIDQTRLSPPNSAGGCDYSFYYVNKSNKTIKYLNWSGTIYNAVNDPVYCDIRRTSTFKGKDTGPVAPGETGGGKWNYIVYNYAADTVKLNSISIDFVDGSNFRLSASDIRALVNAPRIKYMYVVGSDEYRDIEAARNSVISDFMCADKIMIWGDRLGQIQKKDFRLGGWERYKSDNSYNEVYKRLSELESEAYAIRSEIYRFERFINFEEY